MVQLQQRLHQPMLVRHPVWFSRADQVRLQWRPCLLMRLAVWWKQLVPWRHLGPPLHPHNRTWLSHQACLDMPARLSRRLVQMALRQMRCQLEAPPVSKATAVALETAAGHLQVQLPERWVVHSQLFQSPSWHFCSTGTISTTPPPPLSPSLIMLLPSSSPAHISGIVLLCLSIELRNHAVYKTGSEPLEID